MIPYRLSSLSHCKSGTEQERCYCNQCNEVIGCTFSLFVHAWRTCRVCKRKVFHYCCITLVRKIIGTWIHIKDFFLYIKYSSVMSIDFFSTFDT